MIENFEDFDAGAKKRRNVYSIKDRLLGRGRAEVEVREVETNGGGHYKLIQLTKKGIAGGWQRHIETARQCLSAYTGSDCVPAVVYADSERLVVEWISGRPLSLLELGEEHYASLGRFIARSLRDLQVKGGEQVIESLNQQLEILASRNILDTNLLQSIAWLLTEAATPPKSVVECICFGDTALKNFIRDTYGAFHYVDILGIYRAPVGRVFAKQLSMIRPCFRKAFALAYEQALPYPEIELVLPFYHLVYLINRVYAKSQKTGFFQRRRGNKKAQAAINDLKTFARAASAGRCLTEWIMSV